MTTKGKLILFHKKLFIYMEQWVSSCYFMIRQQKEQAWGALSKLQKVASSLTKEEMPSWGRNEIRRIIAVKCRHSPPLNSVGSWKRRVRRQTTRTSEIESLFSNYHRTRLELPGKLRFIFQREPWGHPWRWVTDIIERHFKIQVNAKTP